MSLYRRRLYYVIVGLLLAIGYAWSFEHSDPAHHFMGVWSAMLTACIWIGGFPQDARKAKNDDQA